MVLTSWAYKWRTQSKTWTLGGVPFFTPSFTCRALSRARKRALASTITRLFQHVHGRHEEGSAMGLRDEM